MSHIRRARKRLRRSKHRPFVRKRKKTPDFYQTGYEAGYHTGVNMGHSSFGTLFEGTSIIIPSFNQVEYLKKCIDSINEHTDEPYEIIVIDNASTDGTADYLRSLSGRIRYRILESNRGFAGATNIGLMMAKGQTLMLLNNDTIVTERWLSNMLTCLTSDPRIGMVGPVTNYISGDQQIDVPYNDVRDMPEFAGHYNQSDPSKWYLTDRLVGFCLLFRRELWERTGYLDEGFEIGNFEDDDYNIRVRLQGYMLIKAKDTFIHHFGSVSMKALGERFNAVNEDSRLFFSNKWGASHEIVFQARESLKQDWAAASNKRPPDSTVVHAGETAFYPEQAVVRGIQDTCYWIENGYRRPIAGSLSFAPTLLSQVDLRRWPIGEAIDASEVEQRWRSLETTNPLVRVQDTFYLLEEGRRRKVATLAAAARWGLDQKPALEMNEEELHIFPEGLPVIAPARTAAFL